MARMTWREARDAAGLTIDDVMYELRISPLPPSQRISRSTLGLLEKTGKGGKLIAVAELARIYGAALGDIDPERAREYEQVVALVRGRGDGWAARDSNPEPADSKSVAEREFFADRGKVRADAGHTKVLGEAA